MLRVDQEKEKRKGKRNLLCVYARSASQWPEYVLTSYALRALGHWLCTHTSRSAPRTAAGYWAHKVAVDQPLLCRPSLLSIFHCGRISTFVNVYASTGKKR
jgi:hypothetical protein